MLDRGMRRAAQAKRASGMTVAGPANSSQKVAAGLAVKWPCPVASMKITQARPGAASSRHSMKRPVWASTETRFLMMP
ncbi:hypothetical protein D3C85_1141790 [compost metagenome]